MSFPTDRLSGPEAGFGPPSPHIDPKARSQPRTPALTAGERCIPAHMKVTVRNRAADPEGFDRLRPCCKSTNGVPWTLQSDAGEDFRL